MHEITMCRQVLMHCLSVVYSPMLHLHFEPTCLQPRQNTVLIYVNVLVMLTADKAVSVEQASCYRSILPGSCSHPLAQKITKQICCCSRVGKAWGLACERCPLPDTGMSLSLLPELFSMIRQKYANVVRSVCYSAVQLIPLILFSLSLAQNGNLFPTVK